MNRVLGGAVTLLMVPVVAVTMATTASASSAIHTIVKAGSHWTIDVEGGGCENEFFKTATKFVADEEGDKGTWKEPTHSTIAMLWSAGEDKGTVLVATFNASTGHYTGTIKFPAIPQFIAVIVPGTSSSGC
jgi:hypothetical protein